MGIFQSTCRYTIPLQPLPPYTKEQQTQLTQSHICDQPFRHDYGFGSDGLRISPDSYEHLITVKEWDIHELAKLVDVMTWVNIKDDDWILRHYSLSAISQYKERGIPGVTEYMTMCGNLAYIVLYSDDPNISRRAFLMLTKEREITADRDVLVRLLKT